MSHVLHPFFSEVSPMMNDFVMKRQKWGVKTKLAGGGEVGKCWVAGQGQGEGEGGVVSKLCQG